MTMTKTVNVVGNSQAPVATRNTDKKAPSTRRTSLYRLRSAGPVADEDLHSLVLPKYLERKGFTVRQVDHDGMGGLLITGTVAPGSAAWCGPLGVLTGLHIQEENSTAFGLLLVRTDVAIYAIAYGGGHLMIDPSRIDPGFGIEFAVRCLDASRITKISRQVMDARGRNDENSVMGGDHIRGFGIERYGEIVSKISGWINGVDLTFTKDRKRKAQITGSDRSIKLQLGTTVAGLLQDLKAIEDVCATPSPLPELDFIAQVRPLNPKSAQAQQLDERLDAMLGAESPDRLALTVPSECRDEFELVESFRVTLGGASNIYDELDVDHLIAPVKDLADGARLRRLREGRIQMFADSDATEPLSTSIRADQWLTAEVPDGVVYYFYWLGRWYEIGAEYLATVESRAAEILARPTSVTLPPWTEGVEPDGTERDEEWYNKQIAKQDGYVLLDRKTVRTSFFRGGGLEIADALGPASQLVCVKKADSTAPLNHLFAQGRVAIETLRFDSKVREKFVARLHELVPGHEIDTSFRTPVLVFGILLKDGVPVTANSLFAFAKISLVHTDTMVEGMGARLEIVSISRTQPSGSASPGGH